MKLMNRPQPDEYNAYYASYIEKVNDDVLLELERQLDNFTIFLKSIPPDKYQYAYTAGKWTLQEVLGHILDTERIMAYRLLRFSRNDTSDLAGFDEMHYIQNSSYNHRDFHSLIEEFVQLRKSNLFLFKSLTDKQLSLWGTANRSKVSVRALLFIIAGHLKHHQQVISERYL